MDILLGIGTLSVAALFFAWGYAAHRRPIPARWTRSGGGSMIFCVMLTLAGPVGLGFLITGFLTPAAQWASFTLAGGAVCAALLALAVLGVPMLMRPVRRGAEMQSVPVPVPVPVAEGIHPA